MRQYAGRQIDSETVQGEDIEFIVSNERLAERVRKSSNEEYVIEKLVEIGGDEKQLWDIGACFGIHTLVAANFYDQVVSFEPMPSNRGVLMDNKLVNGFSNVVVSPKALSNESGGAEFAVRQSSDPGYGRHSLTTGDYEKLRSITVTQSRGDDLGFDVPNVVKIDVEGAEGLVLDGMEETLRQDECRHVILETHEPNPVQPSYEDFGYTEDDLFTMLEEAGFTVERMEEDWHLYGRKL